MIFNVVVKHFISRFIFATILVGSFIGITMMVAKSNPIPFDKNTYGFVIISLGIAGALINVFSIGNFILKFILSYLFLNSIMFYSMRKLTQSDMLPLITSYSSILFTLVFFAWFYFRKNVKVNTFLSLREVDQLGNGDTYEKGRQFEEYVAQLYRDIGYKASTTTELRHKGKLPDSIQKRGGSGEQGVDVIIEDHLNNQRVIVQCKHYSSKISNSAIQEIVAAMPLYQADRGIVVTNQYFTEPAKELAFANNISLIDRDALAEFILEAKRISSNNR